MRQGVCKLTKRAGAFVDSHLIPQAFTKLSKTGEFYINGGEENRPKRGWSSWYDKELVTREGEDILAKFDNWGVAELRKLKLVWSGWGNNTSIESQFQREDGFGMRQVVSSDASQLRLFFLSILWRAAATEKTEFDAVVLSKHDLERLRIMLIERNPQPLDFYPITLLQIITKGFQHNLSPIAKDFPGEINDKQVTLRTYRFYFDGLIVLFHKNMETLAFETFKSHTVGFSSDLKIQTQPWERSFQRENMFKHVVEGAQRWPEVISKLLAYPRRT